MVELVILGFLRQRDYHGYELKKDIQRHMGQWTDIKFGSIYHALKKLVERGAVQKVGEERQGSRPDRTIYRVTEKGEEEFLDLLRQLLNRLQRVYLEFDTGFYFAGNLPKDEVLTLLAQRHEQYAALIEKLQDVKQMPVHRRLPRISEVIVDHTILHLKAEMEWLTMAQKRLAREDLYSLPEGEDS